MLLDNPARPRHREGRGVARAGRPRAPVPDGHERRRQLAARPRDLGPALRRRPPRCACARRSSWASAACACFAAARRASVRRSLTPTRATRRSCSSREFATKARRSRAGPPAKTKPWRTGRTKMPCSLLIRPSRPATTCSPKGVIAEYFSSPTGRSSASNREKGGASWGTSPATFPEKPEWNMTALSLQVDGTPQRGQPAATARSPQRDVEVALALAAGERDSDHARDQRRASADVEVNPQELELRVRPLPRSEDWRERQDDQAVWSKVAYGRSPTRSSGSSTARNKSARGCCSWRALAPAPPVDEGEATTRLRSWPADALLDHPALAEGGFARRFASYKRARP